MTTRLATLHELKTVYGLKDAYDLAEIATVNGHNRRVMQKHNAKVQGG